MSKDGRNASYTLDSCPKSGDARKEPRRCEFLIASDVIRSRAGVDDVTDWFRRRRRADDGVDVRTGPSPDAGTIWTGTIVRGSLRRHGAGKLFDRGKDFVRHFC